MEKVQEFYNYLFSASTPEELKKRYIELIKTNHPDKGGSVETCQEINAIFEAWFFHEYEWTRKNRHSMTMDEIRENHGSEKIKEVKRQRIA